MRIHTRSRLRVTFVSEHYPPTDGGVATSSQRVARQLVLLGADVHVICFDHGQPITSPDYVVREYDEGVVVSRVGPFFLKQRLLSADAIPEKQKATLRRRAFAQMCQLVDEHPADIVLSFYLLNAGFMATFLGRAKKLPIVAGVRGNDIGRNIFHTERFAAIQWVVGSATHIVCVNDHLRDRLLITFPDAENKTSVIPNSARVPDVSALDRHDARRVMLKATGWRDEHLVAVFIGTLREKKGVSVLLESLNSLGSEAQIRLLVVGPEIGGYERKVCGELWSRLTAEGLCWATGRIVQSDVRQWVLGADIVVMPSIDDGMANGLLEGMALGLCPVVSNIFADVVRDGENGRVVPSGDAASLAAVLRALEQDRASVSQFGAAARTSRSTWTPESEAAAYLDLADRILEKQSELGGAD